MPTFTITRTLQTANVKEYTNSALAPAGLTLVRGTLDVPAADVTDPTTDCEVGVEQAPAGTSDAEWPSVARRVAAVGLLGNPANDPAQMPFFELGATTLAALAGRRVRGYLLTRTAGKQVGATLEVT